jgi:hypothetical protein
LSTGTWGAVQQNEKTLMPTVYQYIPDFSILMNMIVDGHGCVIVSYLFQQFLIGNPELYRVHEGKKSYYAYSKNGKGYSKDALFQNSKDLIVLLALHP